MFFKQKIPENHIAEFYNHLAIMIRSGIVISKALDILKDQQYTQHMCSIVKEIYINVMSGNQLSDSLAKYPEYFFESEICSIRASEFSDSLTDVLFKCSSLRTENIKLKRKFQTGVLFPLVIFSFAFIIFLIASVFVCNNLFPFIISTGGEIPLISNLIFSLCNFISNPLSIIVTIFSIFIFAYLFSIWKKQNKHHWDWFLWHFPIFGKFIKYKNYTRLCEIMGLMYKSGENILNSLETASASAGNYTMLTIGCSIKDSVIVGNSLADASEKYFPKVMTGFIRMGEESGKLEDCFDITADFYRRESENVISEYEKMIEPFVTSFMGIIVGVFASGLLTPIYNLVSSF